MSNAAKELLLLRLQPIEELLVNVTACHIVSNYAVGHKSRSQCGGQEFDPPLLHQLTYISTT